MTTDDWENEGGRPYMEGDTTYLMRVTPEALQMFADWGGMVVVIGDENPDGTTNIAFRSIDGTTS